jgi:predicted dehydrogenase
VSEQRIPRVGVIGAGGIGRTHIRAWRANDVELVAIADVNADAARLAAAEIGAQAYEDAAGMLAAETLDIVSICTPPVTHLPLVEAAVAAGVAVVCEKPLAESLASAERIAALAHSTGALVTVGFCHRFQPHIEDMRGLIADGAIGTPLTFRNRFAGLNANVGATWFANPALSGGGAMIDSSIHSVDLFRYLIGEPVHVSAVTSARETEHGPALAVEDTAAMLLQAADGTIGVIESSWRAGVGEWTVTVYGSGGTLAMDYDTMTLRHCPAGGEWAEVDVPDGDRFEREMAHVIEVWRGNEEPRVTVDDGVAANRILDAAYRSARARAAPE